jgi:hypothetical protein
MAAYQGRQGLQQMMEADKAKGKPLCHSPPTLSEVPWHQIETF